MFPPRDLPAFVFFDSQNCIAQFRLRGCRVSREDLAASGTKLRSRFMAIQKLSYKHRVFFHKEKNNFPPPQVLAGFFGKGHFSSTPFQKKIWNYVPELVPPKRKRFPTLIHFQLKRNVGNPEKFGPTVTHTSMLSVQGRLSPHLCSARSKAAFRSEKGRLQIWNDAQEKHHNDHKNFVDY